LPVNSFRKFFFKTDNRIYLTPFRKYLLQSRFNNSPARMRHYCHACC